MIKKGMNGILIFGMLFISSRGLCSKLGSLEFPVISQFNGVVTLVTKSGQFHVIKKGEALKEKVSLRTGEKTQVRLELDEKSSVTILENSEIEIPLIDRDSGEVSTVILKSGNIRVDSQGSNQRIFSTPVTQDVYSEVQFLLSYDVSRGRASVTCFRGVINFRGFEAETSARIGPGERAYFQGVLEAGQPTFDVLLKGRRVARGQLGAVESLTPEELNTLQESSLVQKPSPPPKPKKKIRLPGQICDEPYAKLNECVWTCEGLPKHSKKAIKSCDGYQCVRRRCDANGKWSDAFTLPGIESKCQLKPVVQACDY